MTTWPAASTPCTWKTDFAISRPIVEIDCIGCSSESWEPQNGAHSLALSRRWRSRPQHQKPTSATAAASPPRARLGPRRDVLVLRTAGQTSTFERSFIIQEMSFQEATGTNGGTENP